jgi:hypothetical protein
MDRMAAVTGQEDPDSEEGRAYFRDPSVAPSDPSEARVLFRDHLTYTANQALQGVEVHRCDERCTCPVHGTPMYFAPSTGEHACQDVDCKYGHGYETVVDQELMREFS